MTFGLTFQQTGDNTVYVQFVGLRHFRRCTAASISTGTRDCFTGLRRFSWIKTDDLVFCGARSTPRSSHLTLVSVRAPTTAPNTRTIISLFGDFSNKLSPCAGPVSGIGTARRWFRHLWNFSRHKLPTKMTGIKRKLTGNVIRCH